jgi:hypothetical protein
MPETETLACHDLVLSIQKLDDLREQVRCDPEAIAYLGEPLTG